VIRTALRAMLLASTCLMGFVSAALAGGVRESVPTRLVIEPPSAVIVHSLDYAGSTLVIPGQLFVNCYGISVGSPVVLASAPARFTAMPAFASDTPSAVPVVASRRR